MVVVWSVIVVRDEMSHLGGWNSSLCSLCSVMSTITMLRSYHPEHTGSHQNSEVKLDWAGLVLC